MSLQGHKQRVKCNSDLNEEKIWGALRRCPVSRGYTQRVEPPVLRVAATCARIIFFSCVVRRTRSNERYPGSKLNPGTLTAPERFHLVLLRSRPDTVHGFSSRKTQISTPHTRGGFTRPMPLAQHHPCYSGLQVQGTATTPAAQVHIITEDGGKVNWGRGFFSFTPVLFQKNPVPN